MPLDAGKLFRWPRGSLQFPREGCIPIQATLRLTTRSGSINFQKNFEIFT